MTLDPVRERLAILLETAALEAEHLQAIDQRLFTEAFKPERAATLRGDGLLAAQRRRSPRMASASNESFVAPASQGRPVHLSPTNRSYTDDKLRLIVK